MEAFFRHLTPEQRERLSRGAGRQRFAAEAVILRQGERRRALFLLRTGSVRVQREHGEFSIEVSRLGPGEIFGEMSFVEDYEASASVVAVEAAEVEVIEADQIAAMATEDPDFYGRFYQSLAEVLSHRLRETTVRSISDYSWGARPVAEDAWAERKDSEPGSWGGGNPFVDYGEGND